MNINIEYSAPGVRRTVSQQVEDELVQECVKWHAKKILNEVQYVVSVTIISYDPSIHKGFVRYRAEGQTTHATSSIEIPLYNLETYEI